VPRSTEIVHGFLQHIPELSEYQDGRVLRFPLHVMQTDVCRYGSICAGAADFIFRICGLTSHDCFLDIGSGLGQIVTQAAAWAGCRSLVGGDVLK
ncbi:unnamed protein product, partial [Ectocarpus sp. 12 AP-2014]